MKPLIFLTTRSFVNGIRRAMTSPQRLIGLIVVFGYYLMSFARAFDPNAGRLPGSAPPSGMIDFRPEVVDGVVFVIFAVLSLLLLAGSFNPRGGFRPADVDVLFPTPVSPRVVLVFRILRDYLLTLLVPLLLVVFAGPRAVAGYSVLFRNFPEHGKLAGKMFSIAYLMMALCWVCIGYAMSLFINRSDEQSDRNKKIINISLMVSVGLVFAYVAWSVREDPSWETALLLSHNPVLRLIFFTATTATALVMAPFDGSVLEAILGVGGMLLFIIASLHVALTQVDYLYDQAAAKGFATTDMRKLQRSGDTYAVVAERARQGKVGAGGIARIISKWRFRGSTGLLWKELLLQARGAVWQYLIFAPMVLMLTLMPLYAMAGHRDVRGEGALLMSMLGLGVLSLTISNSTSGFIELLRRVDFQKPLPFTPSATVFAEVIGKTVPTFVISSLVTVSSLALDYRIWAYSIAALVMATSLALTWSAVSLLVILLFPDVDDAAQRGFRGLMLLLGCAMTAVVPVGIAVGLMVWGIHPLIIAIPFVLICVAITLGLSVISGGLYVSFNPSE